VSETPGFLLTWDCNYSRERRRDIRPQIHCSIKSYEVRVLPHPRRSTTSDERKVTVQTGLLTWASIFTYIPTNSQTSQRALQHIGRPLFPNFTRTFFPVSSFLVIDQRKFRKALCTEFSLSPLYWDGKLTSSFDSNFLWNIPLSKLYANCLLSMLNARPKLQRGFGRSPSMGPSTTIVFAEQPDTKPSGVSLSVFWLVSSDKL
jgi:hypothetical protein